MANVLFYPPFPACPLLFDQLFRSIWHFLPALNKLDCLIFPYAGDDFALLDAGQILSMAKVYLSRDFDPAIATYAPRFVGKIDVRADRDLDPSRYTKASYPNLKGVIVWYTGDAGAVAAARQIAAQTGAELVWADPTTVQQETLSIIRFV